MKFFLTTCLVLLFTGTAMAQGIQFEEEGTSFADALAKAEAEGKKVFMDCYTTWCTPCKMMDKEIFPLEEVGAYFNEKFVNVKMDMEKGEGPDLGKKYNVSSYPTFLFLDTDGKVINRFSGATNATNFIEQAKITFDPSHQITTLHKRYEDGDRDVDFLLSYLDALRKTGERNKIPAIVNEFYVNTPKEKLVNEKALTILSYSKVLTYDSEAYNFIVTNKEKIHSTKEGQKEFESVISVVIQDYLFKKVKTVSSIEELNAEVEKTESDFVFPPNVKANLLNKLASNYYLSKEDYDNWLIVELENCMRMVEEKKSMQAGNTLTSLIAKIEKDPQFESSGIYEKAIEGTIVVIEKDTVEKFTSLAYRKVMGLYIKMGNREGAQEALNKYIDGSKVTGFWYPDSPNIMAKYQAEIDKIGR